MAVSSHPGGGFMNMLVNLDHFLKDWDEHFNMFFFAIYGLFGRYVLRSHAFRLKIHDLYGIYKERKKHTYFPLPCYFI